MAKKKYFVVETVAGDFVATKTELNKLPIKKFRQAIISKKPVDSYKEFMKKVV